MSFLQFIHKNVPFVNFFLTTVYLLVFTFYISCTFAPNLLPQPKQFLGFDFFKSSKIKMTKTIYTTILLTLFVSVSTFASNGLYDNGCVESTKATSKEISTIKIDKVKSNTNTVSYIMKYGIKKHSSRKSRMNNVHNYLKNPEKLDRTLNMLC